MPDSRYEDFRTMEKKEKNHGIFIRVWFIEEPLFYVLWPWFNWKK